MRGRGIESEAELPFAALLEICRPFLDGLDQLLEPQAAALRGALALAPTPPRSRFAVAAATLGLLAAAAEKAPLLVTVDDAHWLDRGSADAIAFAARRLGADRVALLLAIRPRQAHAVALQGLEEPSSPAWTTRLRAAGWDVWRRQDDRSESRRASV